MNRPDQNQKGIALLVVMWVLVLMMALATEFGFTMKTEVNTTRNYKEDVESYHLSRAGVQLAMAEILRPTRFHSIHDEFGWINGNPLTATPQEGSPPLGTAEEDLPEYEVVERTDIPLGPGTITYSIEDENGKIPVNKASREVLVKVLAASGLEISEKRDIIADSILDWIDADSTHHLNGAEDDYYQRQSPPYKAKNAPIENLQELLQVRGITEEILYGTEESGSAGKPRYLGLEKFLTVYDVGTVNPNTAAPEVLPVFFDETQVQEILKARAEKGYYNETLSTYFRITSTGKIDGSPTRHTITAVIEKKGTGDNASLMIHFWNDNTLEL